MSTALPLRKRSFDSSDSSLDSKRPRRNNFYYFRLASESSAKTEDDTESVYSVQGRETEVVKDTTDTDFDSSDLEVDVDVIEYDIDSASDSDKALGNFICGSSSDSEDIMLAVKAVVCESSLENFVTDAEESDDNSRHDDSSSGLRDYWACVKCKSQNDNPQFRFCDKCYQDRKTFFPPRPRRHRKAKRTAEPVKLNSLQSCLSGLSQDSGIGSQDSGIGSQDSGIGSQDSGIGSQDSGIGSQDSGISSLECPPLDLDQIVVPEHLNPQPSTSDEGCRNRKRCISESSIEEEVETKRPRRHKPKTENSEVTKAKTVEIKENAKTVEIKENGEVTKESKDEERTGVGAGPLPELKEICIMCRAQPKNSVFLHGRIAHMCCCYACAMIAWKRYKRCPICNRRVSNVVRVFTA